MDRSVGVMLIVSALILWALAALLAGWWLTRAVVTDEPAAPPVPDPVEALVDKWAHDWERGRA